LREFAEGVACVVAFVADRTSVAPVWSFKYVISVITDIVRRYEVVG
jgi:hypothetical protein